MQINPTEILKELIVIDSQCTTSNKNIVGYIKNKLSKFKIQEFLFKKGNLDLFNLIVKISGKSSEEPLIFASHVDTIPASDLWKRNPFTPFEEEGRIYGLGASDMKGGIACVISAALSLENPPKNDIYLLFEADEEGSLMGGEKMIKDITFSNAKIIIPESSDKKIVYAQKGCLDMEILVYGQGMHSAKTNSENNERNSAVYKAIRICECLKNYGRNIEKRKNPLLGSPNLNIGFISGGTAPNVVADKAIIKLSRRTTSEENLNTEFQKISEIAKIIDENVETRPLFWGEPFYTDPEGELVNQVKKASESIIPDTGLKVKEGWTEAALFSKWGEAVIFGPGISDNGHKPDEFIEIEDLNKFTQIYFNLMSG